MAGAKKAKRVGATAAKAKTKLTTKKKFSAKTRNAGARQGASGNVIKLSGKMMKSLTEAMKAKGTKSITKFVTPALEQLALAK